MSDEIPLPNQHKPKVKPSFFFFWEEEVGDPRENFDALKRPWCTRPSDWAKSRIRASNAMGSNLRSGPNLGPFATHT